MPIDSFLASANWTELSIRLTAYAQRRLRRVGVVKVMDAEEVAQEALRRLFDPKYRLWTPLEPTLDGLINHLGSEVNGIISNLRRRQARWGDALSFEDRTSHRLPTAQGLDCAADILARLEATGEDDAADIFRKILEGNLVPAEQAESLRWPPQRVYEARRRLRDAVRVLHTGRRE